MAAGDLHGSVQARKLEEELTTARTKLRTELECESRSELQKDARKYGIAANLKSSVIIDGVLFYDCDKPIWICHMILLRTWSVWKQYVC